MKKSDFVTMLLVATGGLCFALGMCMCLLPEWGAFGQGVAFAVAGILVLLAMLVVRRSMQRKAGAKTNGKTTKVILLGIVGSLLLGVGMCMAMVWEGVIVPGIGIGVFGIVLLLCLVPLILGIKPYGPKQIEQK